MRKIIVVVVFSMLVFACKKDTTFIPKEVDKTLDQLPVGASSKDFLTTQKYNSMKVEIQYMPGFQPDAASINQISTFLGNLVNKPGGIQIIQKEIAGSGKTQLSIGDIAIIADKRRTVYSSGTELGVHILFTDANSDEGSILGFAYKNTSLVLFGRIIRDNSNRVGKPTKTKLESTILNHELGHLLGLVNLGAALVTNHEDTSHPNHCNNPQCLMYYSATTTEAPGMGTGSPVPDLDANCKADLKANGGK